MPGVEHRDRYPTKLRPDCQAHQSVEDGYSGLTVTRQDDNRVDNCGEREHDGNRLTDPKRTLVDNPKRLADLEVF